VTGQYAQARERAASVAQYVLLGGFAAVAAGISAQGLTGFARSNMELAGAWPYLLFFALDGAAGVCAVLLVRRAARAESSLAPRLAVWGLVAASSTFNWTHAPRRPAAAEAFGLMPVVAALLFEFCLRELRPRTGRPDRQQAKRLALAPPGRTHPGPDTHGHRRAGVGGGSHQVRPGRPRGQAAPPVQNRARRSRPVA